MLYDILTILQKDLKEILVQRGSIRGGISNLLIVIAICGILFPWQNGQSWITSPIGLITAAWLPMFMSMGLIADAIAGERERHTLETLLSSRLSDQAILFGKIGAAAVYGLGIALTSMLLGAVTVNLTFPGTGFYPLPFFFAAVGFSLLGMLLISGIGVLVSLHASNVRQAYQRMSLGFIILWLPLILGPQFLPDSWKTQLVLWLSQINPSQAVAGAAILLGVIDIILLRTAVSCFQRSRLILD